MIGKIAKCLQASWERALFALFGLVFFAKCFQLLAAAKITDAAIVFGLGFLSFIFSNVARFKKFKGLGFEAELWENKQKEAADLIEKLREVVSIYTQEVVMGKVKSGRIFDSPKWSDRWNLFNSLVKQHSSLGQKIDFSSLKKEIDDYFLFDMTIYQYKKIREIIIQGKNEVEQKIRLEFGSPVRDNQGYRKKHEQLQLIQTEIKDAFEISTKDNLAENVLDIWQLSP